MNNENNKKKKSVTYIVNMISRNVTGVTAVEKQKGTNVWLIRAGDVSPEIAANNLKELGFKICGVNPKTHMIVAEYMDVENTTYNRQITRI